MRVLQRISILVGLACLSAPALAGSMPPDIADKLQAMGRKIVVPETNALYAPLRAGRRQADELIAARFSAQFTGRGQGARAGSADVLL